MLEPCIIHLPLRSDLLGYGAMHWHLMTALPASASTAWPLRAPLQPSDNFPLLFLK